MSADSPRPRRRRSLPTATPEERSGSRTRHSGSTIPVPCWTRRRVSRCRHGRNSTRSGAGPRSPPRTGSTPAGSSSRHRRTETGRWRCSPRTATATATRSVRSRPSPSRQAYGPTSWEFTTTEHNGCVSTSTGLSRPKRPTTARGVLRVISRSGRRCGTTTVSITFRERWTMSVPFNG